MKRKHIQCVFLKSNMDFETTITRLFVSLLLRIRIVIITKSTVTPSLSTLTETDRTNESEFMDMVGRVHDLDKVKGGYIPQCQEVTGSTAAIESFHQKLRLYFFINAIFVNLLYRYNVSKLKIKTQNDSH